MEIVLLLQDKDYKKEVPFFISECKRLAKKYDKTVEAIDSVNSTVLKAFHSKADVVIIVLDYEEMFRDAHNSCTIRTEIGKELNKLKFPFKLGVTYRFAFGNSKIYQWLTDIKKEITGNCESMRHYS